MTTRSRHVNPATQLTWSDTTKWVDFDGYSQHQVVGNARLGRVVIRWSDDKVRHVEVNGLHAGTVWCGQELIRDQSLKCTKEWAQNQLNARTQDTEAHIAWSGKNTMCSDDGVEFHTIEAYTPQGKYSINFKSNNPGVYHIWFFGDLLETKMDSFNRGEQYMLESIKHHLEQHYINVVMTNLETYNRGYFI